MRAGDAKLASKFHQLYKGHAQVNRDVLH